MKRVQPFVFCLPILGRLKSRVFICRSAWKTTLNRLKSLREYFTTFLVQYMKKCFSTRYGIFYNRFIKCLVS